MRLPSAGDSLSGQGAELDDEDAAYRPSVLSAFVRSRDCAAALAKRHGSVISRLSGIGDIGGM